MSISTQYFSVSIEDGDSQGIYCAYCGKKIVPTRDEDSEGFVFQCSCIDAHRERELYEQRAAAETELDEFLSNKSGTMQINELRTRIVVYEQHIHEMKRRLQELLNAAAGVEEKPGVSELHVNLNSLAALRGGKDPHLALEEDQPTEVLDTVLEDIEVQQKALQEHLDTMNPLPVSEEFTLDLDTEFGLSELLPSIDIENVEMDEFS